MSLKRDVIVSTNFLQDDYKYGFPLECGYLRSAFHWLWSLFQRKPVETSLPDQIQCKQSANDNMTAYLFITDMSIYWKKIVELSDGVHYQGYTVILAQSHMTYDLTQYSNLNVVIMGSVLSNNMIKCIYEFTKQPIYNINVKLAFCPLGLDTLSILGTQPSLIYPEKTLHAHCTYYGLTDICTKTPFDNANIVIDLTLNENNVLAEFEKDVVATLTTAKEIK